MKRFCWKIWHKITEILTPTEVKDAQWLLQQSRYYKWRVAWKTKSGAVHRSSLQEARVDRSLLAPDRRIDSFQGCKKLLGKMISAEIMVDEDWVYLPWSEVEMAWLERDDGVKYQDVHKGE